MKVIGYGRVSTGDQAEKGTSLEAQHGAVDAEAARRGWDVQWLADEGVSGKSIDRPRMNAALALLAAGEAEALVATKVDRLSRSVQDFAGLVATAKRQGWNMVVLDLGMDMTTPWGKALASTAAVFAELERDLIGQRTREALAVKKAQGVRIGRPRTTPDDVVARVVRERMAGSTLRAIADGLDADGVPTAQGGKRWQPGTIKALLAREAIC
jgi:DNA invertase Pin-like site-specific DNA recombinase